MKFVMRDLSATEADIQFARMFRPTHTQNPTGRNPIARGWHRPRCQPFFYLPKIVYAKAR